MVLTLLLSDPSEETEQRLTVAVVNILWPPHHGVGLPVPDTAHHLLLQLLHPGELVVGAVVHDLIPQLPLLVRPVYVHPLPGWRDLQTALSL